MHNLFEDVKKIILDYEDHKISSEIALELINGLSNTPVDRVWLDTYWNSMDLNEFVSLITIAPIENWKEMTDIDSLKLISEILDNTVNSAIMQRNMEALEKRYSKPHGTISDWIFHNDICNPMEILNLLKINTSIAL